MRAVFTSRAGGVSPAPFDSFNLGDHVGDAPTNVSANRAALHSAIGNRPVFLKQVHGNEVLVLDHLTADGQVADACVTTERGVACSIMVADCLPVLLTSEDGSRVAAAHAGWRGLAGAGGLAGKGVLEAVLDVFYKRFRPLALVERAEAAIKIIAWLGPCIGPTAFEVGAEVKDAFLQNQPDAARFFLPVSGSTSGESSGESSVKYLADLAGLARQRLQALGVSAIYGNDSSLDWCTASNPSRFFSHRRDAAVGAGGTGGDAGNGFGTTGRMAACIWRV